MTLWKVTKHDDAKHQGNPVFLFSLFSPTTFGYLEQSNFIQQHCYGLEEILDIFPEAGVKFFYQDVKKTAPFPTYIFFYMELNFNLYSVVL